MPPAVAPTPRCELEPRGQAPFLKWAQRLIGEQCGHSPVGTLSPPLSALFSSLFSTLHPLPFPPLSSAPDPSSWLGASIVPAWSPLLSSFPPCPLQPAQGAPACPVPAPSSPGLEAGGGRRPFWFHPLRCSALLVPTGGPLRCHRELGLLRGPGYF